MTSPKKKTQPAEASPKQALKKAAVSPTQPSSHGAPFEHYHGEPTGKHVGAAGDLEQETLDQNAPFNKTYGIEKD